MTDERPSVPSGAPAAGEVHSHPLPMSVRLVLVVFGLVLGVTGAIVLEQLASADERAAAQVAEAKRQVMAELDARTEARDRSDAEQREQTRLAVCTVIGESFQPTDAIAELSRALGCPVDAAGQPVPEAAPPPAAARPGPAPARDAAQPPDRERPSSEGAEPDTAQPPPSSGPQPPSGSPPPPPPDDPGDEPPGPLPPVTCTVPVLGPVICS